MKNKKNILIAVMILLVAICAFAFTACDETPVDIEQQNLDNARDAACGIVANQPAPTDIDSSLERYNVIKRAYWVNGQREKAMAVTCDVDKPLGYIVLFSESGATIGRFIVDGKVSSLNSYLFPAYIQEIESHGSNGCATKEIEIPAIDGMYGRNIEGIFFFTPDGKYIEWTGDFLYSDIPFTIDDPVLHIEGDDNE